MRSAERRTVVSQQVAVVMLAHQACGAAPTLGIAAGQVRKVDCPAGGYLGQPTSPAALAEELHPGRHGRAIGRCGDEAAASSPTSTSAPTAPPAAALSEEDLALVFPDQ